MELLHFARLKPSRESSDIPISYDPFCAWCIDAFRALDAHQQQSAMNPLSAIGPFFSAIAETAKLWYQRISLQNTPDMQARAKAQAEVDAQAKEREAVKKADLDAIRKNVSLLIACFVLAGLTSCGTVTPKPVSDSAYSFDASSGAWNSGILELTHNQANHVTGAVITPEAHKRLCDLVEYYGDAYAKETGIKLESVTIGVCGSSTQTWTIDAEELTAFETMTRWRKEGK